ncbi:MAG: hypothetical protein HEQ22_14855 [Sphingopyxis sp.]
MAGRQFGRGRTAVWLPLAALALGTADPTLAQQTETPAPTPAPSTGRTIDFRLPPADDGRAPGVQGPADNGLPPLAPGEQRGPAAPPTTRTPTRTPTPTPAAPRVIPTQPAPSSRAAESPATPRRDAPAAAAPAPRDADDTDAAPTAPPATEDAAPSFDLSPSAPDPAPADVAALPSEDAAPPATGQGGTPLWAWALAVLAALGAGLWYWRRRPVAAGPAPAEPAAPPAPPRPLARPLPRATPPTPAAPPRPAAPAVPAPASAPQPAAPLVTRPTPERRALLAIALDVQSIRVLPDHVAVGFSLNLVNQGASTAVGVLVRVALNQGSAMSEPVLARFFDGAGGSVLRDDLTLAPGAGEGLKTEVMLPRATIEPLMIGGKPMLIPVMAFDVTYHWDGDDDSFGQVAGSFVLGREPAAGAGDKLAPLALDRASYRVDRPGSRATAVRRGQ